MRVSWFAAHATSGPMKRFAFVAVVACVCGYALPGTGRAGMVTVDFSGSVTSSGEAYAQGTAYSGSFTYDPTAAATFHGRGFTVYPNVSFNIDIGGDSLSEGGGGDFEVSSGGLVELSGTSMAGTGPYVGYDLLIFFVGSSDPTIAMLDLPSSFPTDFTSTSVEFTDGQELGPLTSYSQVTPEPASLTLLGLGAVGLVGYRWRKRVA